MAYKSKYTKEELMVKFERGRQAINKGVEFQQGFLREDGGYIWDGYRCDAFHKQAYSWNLVGKNEEAHRLLNWIRDNRIRPDGSLILVPTEKIAKFKDESYIGKEVIMGIRPENMDDAPEYVAAHPESTMNVHVEVTELMGSETYLYFTTSGKEENVIARVDPRTVTRAGDDTKVALDTARLHFFDKETEETLLNR